VVRKNSISGHGTIPVQLNEGDPMEKRGRKRNSIVKQIRAIAWYHCVARVAGIEKPAQLGKIFQAEESRVWNKHQKGKPPGPTTLRLAEQKYPDTSNIFENGPDDSMLWDAMERATLFGLACRPSFQCRMHSGAPSYWLASYKEFIDDYRDGRGHQFGAECSWRMLAGERVSYPIHHSPWVWLAGLIALYRMAGDQESRDVWLFGQVESHHVATVAFALLKALVSSPSFESQLRSYGIAEILGEWVDEIELSRLEDDVELANEIEHLGRLIGSESPQRTYLSDPVEFVHRATNVSEEAAKRLMICHKALFPEEHDYERQWKRENPEEYNQWKIKEAEDWQKCLC